MFYGLHGYSEENYLISTAVYSVNDSTRFINGFRNYLNGKDRHVRNMFKPLDYITGSMYNKSLYKKNKSISLENIETTLHEINDLINNF